MKPGIVVDQTVVIREEICDTLKAHSFSEMISLPQRAVYGRSKFIDTNTSTVDIARYTTIGRNYD